MVEDEVREKLDNVVSDALGLDNDLSVVRKLLAAEPVISMRLPA